MEWSRCTDGIENPQEVPGPPAEDLQEGALHRLDPAIGIALGEHHLRIGIRLEELVGEKDAGNVRHGLDETSW